MSISSVYRERGNKYMSIHHKVIGEGIPIVMLHGWTLDHQVIYMQWNRYSRNEAVGREYT